MSANMQQISAQEPQQREPKVTPSLGSLFIAFLKLGMTAFGGPAMVAYIRELAVDRKGWLDALAFDDGVALCQAVPGATAMQTAAYVGLRLRGVAGAASAFVGFALPAFVMMLALSAVYARTHNLPTAVATFRGLQAIVVAIVANAAVSFGRATVKRWRHLPITALAVALFGWGLNPFLVIVLSALLGLWLYRQQPPAESAESGFVPMPHTTKPVIILLGAAAVLLAALFLLNRQLYALATMMLRIDLFAFGGGFASLPLLFNEVVSTRQWLDGPTLLDGIVLGQVTPGPIVITATYVGYMLHGISGAVVATLGVFLPSFLIVVATAPHFDRLRAMPLFVRLIGGALCSFPGLLVVVTVHFAQDVRWDVSRLLLAGSAFVALRCGMNILWVVLIGTGLSLLCCR
ncbi:MAG: chromate efflux transporter [Verrucomicrobia bacterium]|nr:chromate efflux transporter [Verrucomicrobiota bacterium]